MMRWWIGALAALACAWSGAAAAQDINTEQVAAYCTAEGGFGQRFGAESVSGSAGQRMMNSTFVTPQTPYPPFGELEVVFTHLSQRIHTINASARFANEAAAQDAFDVLDEALSRRFAFSGDNEIGDGVAYYSVDPDTSGGYSVELVLLEREIQLICIDRTLRQQTMDEFLGRATVAQRPEPPRLALPAEPAANVCTTEETRSAFLADFEPRLDEIMQYGAASGRYSETLANWKNQQMIQRGLWTEAESQNFALRLLEDPQFMRHFQSNMGGVLAMMTAAQAMENAGDDTGRCAAGVRILRTARGVVTGAEAHWSYLDERYDAEARRRGGTLD
jgi:hypothetical protein